MSDIDIPNDGRDEPNQRNIVGLYGNVTVKPPVQLFIH
jgi:hypothetical protein